MWVSIRYYSHGVGKYKFGGKGYDWRGADDEDRSKELGSGRV
jgi:hypothetical protein